MKYPHYLFLKSRRSLSIAINIFIILSLLVPITALPAYALGIPVPQSPANFSTTTPAPGSYPPLGVPNFSWTGVTGATMYRLQVSSEIGFNTLNVNITTANTAFTPSALGNLFSDGLWYWRVRTESPTPIGDWSEIWQFTKTWATPENKPNLVSPANSATLSFFNAPNFSWTRVIGAAKYRFQIALDAGFTSMVPLPGNDTLSTTYQPNIKLAYGTYYWRVIPIDAADHLGTFSDVRSFTMAYGTYAMGQVPSLLSPLNNSNPTFTPTFHWTAVEGSELYILQYSTNCEFTSNIIERTTRLTYFTPTETLPNDVKYCWRVRVKSGAAYGDWSQVWNFTKTWYLQPVLLTPTLLYPNALYPIYSWTPVPGASRYKIEISENPSFSPVLESSTTANTTYAPQSIYKGNAHYYWRVTPIDGGSNEGLKSDVSEYQSYATSTAPSLISPLYYYQPNNFGGPTMSPYEDRTVAYPIFIWHRVMVPSPIGGVFAEAYRIQVDDNYLSLFTDPDWEYDTQNTSATPTLADNFVPSGGLNYYWRVCPLDAMGGVCLDNLATATPAWSQVWTTRFNTGLALQPTPGATPDLLRPVHGHEAVEATPLLEWMPLHDTTQYQIEVSRAADLSNPVISEFVTIPAYSPKNSLAQRNLDLTDYGTFYWHVKGLTNSVWGEWSPTWRFQIASQSEWRYNRSLGNVDNRLLIGDDNPADAPDPSYELANVYASQSNTYWFLGFDANLSGPDMTYVFFIDLDHVDNSGATTQPALYPYLVSTIPAHRPEYAIYIRKIGGVIDKANTCVWKWNPLPGSWSSVGCLNGLSGADVYAASGFVELQLPNGAIGMSQATSSASVMLFSVNPSTNELVDSVPSDPLVPSSPGIAPQLSRFSAVSERMNLVSPFNTVGGDPTTIPSALPFYWDWPTGSNPSTPWAGSKLEIHLDAKYTTKIAEFQITSDSSYFGENNVSLLKDFNGDNIYYWRIQPRYWLSGNTEAFGAWTGGSSFRRLGFTPQNLNTSVAWATPTFSWDMVEGANTYQLQVATSQDFTPGTVRIDIPTAMNSYTPESNLPQGTYYWRVKITRFGGITNDWSQVEQFSLNLPVPTGLAPNGINISYAPTYCWNPIIKNNEQAPFEPLLTAWKYRVEVSRDPSFSTLYETIDAFNTCWTPTKGYDDGTYYWHVAMIDGNSNFGSYSPTATFTKQYPITNLISPIGSVSTTPTFIWTPVDGAASYRLEVSKSHTFAPTYDSIESINTQFTPTKVYDTNIPYFWRVAIKDRDGKLGPFTDATIIIGYGVHIMLPIINK